MKRLTLAALLGIIFVLAVYAQDIFHVEIEEFPIIQRDVWISRHYEPCDLDNDGIMEIVVTCSHIHDSTHFLRILKNGELWIETEPLAPRAELAYIPRFADMNSDGYVDIFFYTDHYHRLEVYGGPDYDLIFGEQRLFRRDIIVGGTGLNINGNETPFFTESVIHHETSPRYDSLFCYMFNRLYIGSFLLGSHQLIDSIPIPIATNFIRDNNVTKCCIVGFKELFWDSPVVRLDTVYFQLQVIDIENQIESDTLQLATLWRRGRFENNIALSENSFCFDVNSDGIFEWLVPWAYQVNPDSFVMHFPIYNPENLTLTSEYTECFAGTPHVDPGIEYHNKGGYPIDYNNDGVYEILIGMRSRPLRLIDPISCEVIASSDTILPDIFGGHIFELGRFQNDVDNLQLLVRGGRDYLLYNLPEEWSTPNSVIQSRKTQPTVPFLVEAFPNPFNSVVNLNIQIFDSNIYSLNVCGLDGRSLLKREITSINRGKYKFCFNAENWAAGVYFLNLTAKSGNRRESFQRKLVLMR